jgi:hypothetical protein
MEGRVRVGEGNEVGEVTGGVRDDLEFMLVMSNEARQSKYVFVFDSTPYFPFLPLYVVPLL